MLIAVAYVIEWQYWSMHRTLLFYETHFSCRNYIGSHHDASGTDLGQNKKSVLFFEAAVSRLEAK